MVSLNYVFSRVFLKVAHKRKHYHLKLTPDELILIPVERRGHTGKRLTSYITNFAQSSFFYLLTHLFPHCPYAHII